MTATSVTAAVYTRLSQVDRDLDAQAQLAAVRRQEQDCRTRAEVLGWEVGEVYCDQGRSAFSGTRPAYQRLLADMRAGEVPAVIFWHVDRLTRQPAELEELMDIAIARGIELEPVMGSRLDFKTSSGRLAARLLGSVARAESERSSERIKAQKTQARAAGRWIGHPIPFGFRVEDKDGEKRLVEVPLEAKVVREAIRDYLAGTVGLHGIARRWTALGHTTRRTHKPWYKRAVISTLQSGPVGTLVDEPTRAALLAKLNDPARRKTVDTNTLTYVGSHLYRCGDCGTVMVAGNGQYLCDKHEPRLTRTAAPIDKLVRAAAVRYLVEQNVALLPAADETGPLRDRLAELTAHSNAIAGLLGAQQMTVDQFAAANGPVQAEAEAISARLGRIQAGSILGGVADAPNPADAFMACDLHRQRAVLGELVEVTLLRTPRGAGMQRRTALAKGLPDPLPDSIRIVFK